MKMCKRNRYKPRPHLSKTIKLIFISLKPSFNLIKLNRYFIKLKLNLMKSGFEFGNITVSS